MPAPATVYTVAPDPLGDAMAVCHAAAEAFRSGSVGLGDVIARSLLDDDDPHAPHVPAAAWYGVALAAAQAGREALAVELLHRAAALAYRPAAELLGRIAAGSGESGPAPTASR